MQSGLFRSHREAFAFIAAGTLASAVIFGTCAWLFLSMVRFTDALTEGRAFPTIPHEVPAR